MQLADHALQIGILFEQALFLSIGTTTVEDLLPVVEQAIPPGVILRLADLMLQAELR